MTGTNQQVGVPCPPRSSNFMAERMPQSTCFFEISAAPAATLATATVRSCARCHSQGNARRRNRLFAQLCADSALRAEGTLPSAMLRHCLPQHPKSQGRATGLPTATLRHWRTDCCQLRRCVCAKACPCCKPTALHATQSVTNADPLRAVDAKTTLEMIALGLRLDDQ